MARVLGCYKQMKPESTSDSMITSTAFSPLHANILLKVSSLRLLNRYTQNSASYTGWFKLNNVRCAVSQYIKDR